MPGPTGSNMPAVPSRTSWSRCGVVASSSSVPCSASAYPPSPSITTRRILVSAAWINGVRSMPSTLLSALGVGRLRCRAPTQAGDERRERARGDRRAPEEALADGAAELVERDPLLDGLDALGDDRETEAVAEGDDGFGDRAVVLVAGQSVDERTVDLEAVDRQLLEVCERRVAGAEVVDCELHTELTE